MNVKEVKAVTKVMLDFPYNDSPSRSEVQQWAIRLENAVAEQSEAPLSVALDDVVEKLRGELLDSSRASEAGSEFVSGLGFAIAFIEREFGSPEGGGTE